MHSTSSFKNPNCLSRLFFNENIADGHGIAFIVLDGPGLFEVGQRRLGEIVLI